MGDSDPAIDHAKLLVLLDGQLALVAEVAAVFVAEHQELTVRLRDAHRREDRADLQVAAHGLRGALGMVAATGAAALARELETRDLEAAARARLLDQLDAEIARAAAALARYR